MHDINKIRKDFPILGRKVNGRPVVYLDNAATSQKPECVIKALKDYYEQYNANIHRGIHTLSEEATEAYESVREKVRQFIGAPESRTIIFTRNTTEAINLVAQSWGRANISAGDEIVLSAMEHHSNLVPWQLLAAERGAELKFIELTADGQIDLESARGVITPRTKLVAITQMSNVLGTITPVREIVEIAQAVGAKVLVDGAQGVPHLPTDVKELGCDFLVFSFHKMLGPTGVGILWARPEILEAMPPFLSGGDMISAVWRDRARWNELPWKFEAGTPNIGDVIACGMAIDYLQGIGMENVRAHEIELTDYALKGLQSLADDVIIYGPLDARKRGGVISFNFKDVHPHDVGQILNEAGIAIRAGHHCCQPLMRDLNVAGTARASFYVYNTKEEVDALLEALKEADKVMGHVACR
ncbi:MAG TPA: cysteine desulfurase [Candidatus Obscuribacterales bacterium]